MRGYCYTDLYWVSLSLSCSQEELGGRRPGVQRVPGMGVSPRRLDGAQVEATEK